MIIKYYWNDMRTTIIVGGYPKEIITDVEYEYHHTIRNQDIVSWLMPANETQKGMANYYMSKVLEELKEYIGFEKLEENEDFCEFMHDSYEELAKAEWEDENL